MPTPLGGQRVHRVHQAVPVGPRIHHPLQLHGNDFDIARGGRQFQFQVRGGQQIAVGRHGLRGQIVSLAVILDHGAHRVGPDIAGIGGASHAPAHGVKLPATRGPRVGRLRFSREPRHGETGHLVMRFPENLEQAPLPVGLAGANLVLRLCIFQRCGDTRDVTGINQLAKFVRRGGKSWTGEGQGHKRAEQAFEQHAATPGLFRPQVA